MERTIGPRYIHDCPACVFLGTLCQYDIYYHVSDSSHSNYGEIVLRYGSESDSVAYELTDIIVNNQISPFKPGYVSAYDMQSLAFAVGLLMARYYNRNSE